jgi:uncharacterized protein (TIGR02145 family)
MIMRNVNCIMYFAAVLFLFHSCSSEPEVVDVNKEVKIGTQVWMRKNLDVLYFRNGDPIPIVKDTGEWRKAGEKKQPACCYYDNDSENGEKYGVLYNWYAVADKRGLAPEGWHVPSDDDWTEIIDFLGGDSLASKKMKSMEGWSSNYGQITCPACKEWDQNKKVSDTCGTCKDKRLIPGSISGNGNNSSGFTGLPGGLRSISGKFYGCGYQGYWWSATEIESVFLGLYKTPNSAIIHSIDSDDGDVSKRHTLGTISEQYNGYSVRCLRD